MKYTIAVLSVLIVTAAAANAASPYENLSYALRQQTMINDLRSQCRVPASVSDEKIKSAFLAAAGQHEKLLEAADALKMGQHADYNRLIAGLQCPVFR